MKERNLGSKNQILGTFGHWDVSDPHANPGGIWNDVSIIFSEKLAIEHVRKTTKLESLQLAKEKIHIKITSSENLNATIQIKYIPKDFPGEAVFKEYIVSIQNGTNEYFFELELHKPKLWWTHDYGQQNLYIVEIECYILGSEKEKIILDKNILQTGIKELQMKRSGKDGGIWTIFFNKQRFFPKGTNYPPWQRLQTATKDSFQKDLKLFKDANMNILRMHAHLSRPEFYETCDEEGILLWQDLPLQWIYSKKVFPEIKRQARIAVEIYQSHPSIGIWCAHNEPFFVPDRKIVKVSAIVFAFTIILAILSGIYLNRYIFSIFLSSTLANLLGIVLGGGILLFILWLVGKYYDLYPFGLFFNCNSTKLDPDLYLIIKRVENGQNCVIPYSGICELPHLTIFRSPRLNPKIFGFKRFYTDFHYYAGWYNGSHRIDYRYHIKWWGPNGKLRNKARFVTEYGAQAFPIIENFSKFYPIPSSWPPEPNWWISLIDNHRFQKNLQDKWVKANQYSSLAEYINATQEWQAECIKATTEAFRQIKYAPLSGIITFLGVDCFPAISYAIIDYYRNPKKAYFVVKNIFEPIYTMVDWPKKVYKPGEIYQSTLYLSNDYWDNFENIEINWQIKTPANEILEKGKFNIACESDCVREVGEIIFKIPNEKYLILNLSWMNPKKDNKIYKNTYQLDIGISRWAKNF